MLWVISSASNAQQRGTIARIGLLRPERPGDAGVEALIDAFRRGLRQLGYVEGKNIVLEQRFAEGKLDRLPDLAAELVRLKVDVILALNTPAARAAKNGTKAIPIVFTWVADPLDLVASLARPGGNITGLTTVTADLSAKRLEVLKEALPGLSRVAILWHSDNPIATRLTRDMEDVSPKLGIRIYPLAVRGSDELQKAIGAAAKERVGALFVNEEAVMASYRTRILDLAARHRLPTASFYKEFAEAGGLLTYGADLPDLFRRAATYVDKILKGTKPADLPVEQPIKFEFVVNLKTAKQIGVTIPPNVLVRANKVIR
ncbi:MAG TPA: ABC transporter substrate-binding protein [Candidatus Binatia bacterium]|nr:ABC transporter substrate-binding protein [Candidatus Binatia bacterium]